MSLALWFGIILVALALFVGAQRPKRRAPGLGDKTGTWSRLRDRMHEVK